MVELIDRHTLHITVLTPLHVGTGERVGQKERWEAGGRLWRVDSEALLEKLARSPTLISRFETFCLSPTQSLGDFLEVTKISSADVALYGLPRLGGPVAREVLPFIKTPGKPPSPYLPGSSLKGAVRSAFLRAAIIGDAKLCARAAELAAKAAARHNPKRADDAVEQIYFGRDQHHDWMRLFQFGDTTSPPENALAVTEVRVLSTRSVKDGGLTFPQKESAPGKPMTLHPEVLLPGAKMQGSVGLLSHLLSSPADGELRFSPQRGAVAYLIRQCNRVAAEQIQQEIAFAKKVGWADGVQFYTWLANQLGGMPADTFLLRLGWGAGYDDKTVTDLFDDETFETVREGYNRQMPVGYPGRNPRNPPLPKDLSPKSRKVALDARGQWLPMGWLRVKLG